MASRLVEAMGQRTGAEIIWKPVLLGQTETLRYTAYNVLHCFVTRLLTGGIYDLIKAPQGKDGSATEVMSPAKLQTQGEGTSSCARNNLHVNLYNMYTCSSPDLAIALIIHERLGKGWGQTTKTTPYTTYMYVHVSLYVC